MLDGTQIISCSWWVVLPWGHWCRRFTVSHRRNPIQNFKVQTRATNWTLLEDPSRLMGTIQKSAATKLQWDTNLAMDLEQQLARDKMSFKIVHRIYAWKGPLFSLWNRISLRWLFLIWPPLQSKSSIFKEGILAHLHTENLPLRYRQQSALEASEQL